jgi:hypothetical protein
MGGAVKSVAAAAAPIKDIVATPFLSPVANPLQALQTVKGGLAAGKKLVNGGSLGGSAAAGVKTTFAPGVKAAAGVAGDFAGGVIGGEQEVADPGTPIDPNAVAEANKKEKARARRQAEIDILTDRPGRGGTILTDQYQYKV